MVRTSKTYVRDCTTISPLAILLFGGKLEVFQAHGKSPQPNSLERNFEFFWKHSGED
jgi:hypothetical protein